MVQNNNSEKNVLGNDSMWMSGVNDSSAMREDWTLAQGPCIICDIMSKQAQMRYNTLCNAGKRQAI